MQQKLTELKCTECGISIHEKALWCDDDGPWYCHDCKIQPPVDWEQVPNEWRRD